MKKVVEKEVHFCDECGKEVSYPHVCLGCGKEVCYDCRQLSGITYRHGVSFMGTGDGYFCAMCDANPPEKAKALHDAYQVIQSLRRERESSYQKFEKRCSKAEAIVKTLYEQCKES